MSRKFILRAIDKVYRARKLFASRELKAINAYSMSGLGRLENLCVLARDILTRDVPGDFVECGVCNGGSAAVISSAFRETQRRTSLFDSFAGLPQITDVDGPDAESFVGKCVGSESQVHAAMRLARFPVDRYVIRKGWFEETFTAGPTPEAVAFLHIDADWYERVLLALTNFYDLVPDGGVIVLDDFGHW